MLQHSRDHRTEKEGDDMNATTMKPLKRAILFCTCSGACPSMAKIDFWALAERIRLELVEEIEFMALHPRLCEEDGERLMGHILSDSIPLLSQCLVFGMVKIH